jgi:hypothetical protein
MDRGAIHDARAMLEQTDAELARASASPRVRASTRRRARGLAGDALAAVDQARQRDDRVLAADAWAELAAHRQ